MSIDITLNLGEDAKGKDPDIYSATLKKYHKILWGKELPSGSQFTLSDSSSGKYLVHQTTNLSIELGSDCIANSYANSKSKEMVQILSEVPRETVHSFFNLNNTIGAFILCPSSRVNRKMTINGARGFNPLIADRFDLTLECVRRHYAQEASPLAEVLTRYEEFFNLFQTFENYVEFFFLKNLLTSSGSINFFIKNREPFEDRAYPKGAHEYLEYRENSMNWINARNQTIAKLHSN